MRSFGGFKTMMKRYWFSAGRWLQLLGRCVAHHLFITHKTPQTPLSSGIQFSRTLTPAWSRTTIDYRRWSQFFINFTAHCYHSWPRLSSWCWLFSHISAIILHICVYILTAPSPLTVTDSYFPPQLALLEALLYGSCLVHILIFIFCAISPFHAIIIALNWQTIYCSSRKVWHTAHNSIWALKYDYFLWQHHTFDVCLFKHLGVVNQLRHQSRLPHAYPKMLLAHLHQN